MTDVEAVRHLLACAELGAKHVRLDAALERLVARALASRERVLLRAARLGLLVVQRGLLEDGKPMPARLAVLLEAVRATLKAGAK